MGWIVKQIPIHFNWKNIFTFQTLFAQQWQTQQLDLVLNTEASALNTREQYNEFGSEPNEMSPAAFTGLNPVRNYFLIAGVPWTCSAC